MKKNNLCSIHIEKYNQIKLLTGSPAKAEFLSKCIFWWQISTYTLGDDKIWFTRSIKDMSSESNLSERTIGRYLNELEHTGLIERVSKLRLKKRLYIRITDKLLTLLNQSKTTLKNESTPLLGSTIQKPESIFLGQDGMIEKDKMAVSIYKDKDINLSNNNTVSRLDIVNNLKIDPKKPIETPKQTKPTQTYPIESKIGERITEPFKNYILGTMKNLETQHQLCFSNPDQ